MKRKWVAVAIVAMVSALAGGGAWAAEHANAKEAEAMVKKGVAFIKASGKEKGYAEISSKQSKFKDRDLYLVVYGLDGKVWARSGAGDSRSRNSLGSRDGPPSSGAPNTSRRRPRHAMDTGTRSGAPVSKTWVPRFSPAVR